MWGMYWALFYIQNENTPSKQKRVQKEDIFEVSGISLQTRFNRV